MTGQNLDTFTPDAVVPDAVDPLANVEPRKMSAEEKYDIALQGLLVLAEVMVTIEDAIARGGAVINALNQSLGPDAKARIQELVREHSIAQPRIIVP